MPRLNFLLPFMWRLTVTQFDAAAAAAEAHLVQTNRSSAGFGIPPPPPQPPPPTPTSPAGAASTPFHLRFEIICFFRRRRRSRNRNSSTNLVTVFGAILNHRKLPPTCFFPGSHFLGANFFFFFFEIDPFFLNEKNLTKIDRLLRSFTSINLL